MKVLLKINTLIKSDNYCKKYHLNFGNIKKNFSFLENNNKSNFCEGSSYSFKNKKEFYNQDQNKMSSNFKFFLFKNTSISNKNLKVKCNYNVKHFCFWNWKDDNNKDDKNKKE